MKFAAGATITKREVWDGATWLEHPVVVESDEGPDGMLAVVLSDGAPFTFPPHPGGPHPWSRRDRWLGATVLQVRRPGDWYSVWKFFSARGEFDCWYVNFERPLVRTAQGIDTDDLELDLVLLPNGDRLWKDVERLASRLDQRRFGLDELVTVLHAAADVADLLDRDDRWWAPWDDWSPRSGTMVQ